MINILLSRYNFDESWCYESLKDIINSNHRVLVFPLSFDDNQISSDEDWQKAYNPNYGKYYNEVVSPFASYGIRECNISWINYFLNEKENIRERIEKSDILFFTGGLPDKTIDRLEELGLIKYIETFKGIIIGASAGAMIQTKEYHISPDKDYSTFSYNKGLDIIKNFNIEVHYNETDIQKSSINRVLDEKKRIVYAIKDTGAIIINNNHIELLGDVIEFNKVN
ncbi:Type 1 glutamine amidotransferase-like domain-containing protein [Romboutsia sedimentorum]|uniref:Type 1 glutamine amidotransferase-like domain-containing protein n=1 Tax=Romboutsia sedimentorum TaxID=1368474 RepID=UPI0024DEAE9D|nr:Type 1 glutamine amidotransferase-like domain-containing protein [Romboutsia sedimentorum]MDK2584565.1 Type 1 glutamine amidotransferase-like domain-containing protein [Romboutsia sedimentorum]